MTSSSSTPPLRRKGDFRRYRANRPIAQLVNDEAFLIHVANLVTPRTMRSNVRALQSLLSVATAPVHDNLWLT